MAEQTDYPPTGGFFLATQKDVGDVVRGDVIYLAPGVYRQVWVVSAFHLIGLIRLLLSDGTILTFTSQTDKVRVVEDGQ